MDNSPNAAYRIRYLSPLGSTREAIYVTSQGLRISGLTFLARFTVGAGTGDYSGSAVDVVGSAISTEYPSNGIVFRPGKYKRAVQSSLSGVNNYIINSSFENATPGSSWDWTTASNFPNYGWYGSKCFLSEHPSASITQIVYVPSSGSHTLTFWMRGTAEVEFGDLSGSLTPNASKAFPRLSDEWTQHAASFTQGAPGEVQIGFRKSTASASGSVEIDGIMLDTRPWGDVYIDGSFPGAAFESAGHGSSSFKVLTSRVEFDNVEAPSAGTFMCWRMDPAGDFRTGETMTQGRYYNPVSGATQMYLGYHNSGGTAYKIYLATQNAASAATAVITNDVSAGVYKDGDGKWHHWAISWDMNTDIGDAYFDGSSIAPQRAITLDWNGNAPTRIALNGPGWYEDIAVFNRKLTDDEIRSVYQSAKRLSS